MPQFYFIPKRLARKAPALVSLAQGLEAMGFRFIFWVMHRLSLENARRLSAFAFGLVGPHSDKAKKARINLAIAFPGTSEAWRERTMRGIFRSLGESAAELIKLEQIWEERDKRIDFVVHPAAHELMKEKRAALFITAHVGPWQVAPLVTKYYDLTVNTVYAPESNAVMAKLMLELRHFLAQRLVSTEAGLRPLIKELAAGNSVGMAMDTRPDGGKLVPFFGREALTSTSAAGIALRTGAALLVARAERLPQGRYRITMYEPLTSSIPEAPQKEQVLDLTAQINGYFEDWIREYPDQWICLKRRWPKAHRL